MASSPFDHPALAGLLDQPCWGAQFSWEEDHEFMVYFEEELARAEAAEGVIPQSAAEAISTACGGFCADEDLIRQAVLKDGVVGPEFVRQLRETLPPDIGKYLHFGATSQDLVDTSLILRIRNGLSIFEEKLDGLSQALTRLVDDFGDTELMGVTRMQDALPITVGDRIETWRAPLLRHRARLAELKPRLLVLQFGGAVGTLDKLGEKGEAVRARLAERLQLGLPQGQWHSQRDGIAEFASWLSLVTGSLGKLGQDVALMALRGEIGLKSGGSSSAMPHKQNPVGAEALVTLARFNAVQLSGMHQALVHEQERSGSAWTLEWMILPQMVMATSAALVRAGDLLSNVTTLGRGAE